MRAKISMILMAVVTGWGLAGCVTSGDARESGAQMPVFGNARPGEPAPQVPGLDELPPQNLEAGTCATFFWSADDAHRFLAFENETEGFANIFVNGSAQGFYNPPRERNYVAGDSFRRSYVDPGRDLNIQISGQIGDPLPTGQRIERVVMRVNQPNGQILVIPMIGHYACRTRSQATG
ncbi:MAG: hypothetical protein GYB36_09070 [Alphaproteobacteria bacterium]|nr:hypothetical protein [Alphaproteobacteria bacterium]